MPEPNKIPRAFADSGDKNSIPDSSGSIGFASWQEGFPVITSEPFAQGGVAPKRADFNGIFNALSAATLWYQQGGVFAYSNATDYEIGNVVLYSGNLYKCLAANGPSSAIKSPTDTATWDKIVTESNITSAQTTIENSTIASGVITNFAEVTLTKGTYLFNFCLSFATNTSGYRQMHISTSSTGSPIDRFRQVIFAPCAGSAVLGQLWCRMVVTANSATYYLNAVQNSGSTLNTYLGGYSYIKLKDY